MRIESERPTRNGGWLHRLSDQLKPSQVFSRVRVVRRAPRMDWGETVRAAQLRMSEPWLEDYTKTLGLPPSVASGALRELGAGCWSGYGREWLAVPMYGWDARVAGVRLRHRDGRKLAIAGSQDGLFLGPKTGGVLLVLEGPTDAAAAICAWPGASVIGRPSCRGAEHQLIEHVRSGDYDTVALLADRDPVGLAGARHAAETLALVHGDVRVVDQLPAKDVRDLVQVRGLEAAGQALRELVEKTVAVRIEITWREGRA